MHPDNCHKVDSVFLRKNIGYTNVKPDSSESDIKDFCQKAIDCMVETICVQLRHLKLALSLTNGQGISVGTTSGFPFGKQFRGCLEVCYDSNTKKRGN